MRPAPSFAVKTDVTNPGQFFACCGLLELAHRLWPGSEGWFEDEEFKISAHGTAAHLAPLVRELRKTSLESDDPCADPKTCPLRLRQPFCLRLDWWLDEAGGDMLKTWAGQQSVLRIASAMRKTIPFNNVENDIFDFGIVVRDPANIKKAVEPFYFDARRFAHALDVGFSLDVQNAETTAHPAVELLCLIGLQRFRPSPGPTKWNFDYRTWSYPLAAPVGAAVVTGAVPIQGQSYRFRLHFRDDQKRYKAFGFATRIGDQI